MKILVVDDEPFVLELIEMILKSDGHDLTLAGNGRDGLAKFEEGVFDIVLTDLNMPHLNGLEMAKAMKASKPEIKIILMSGLAERASTPGGLPPNIDLILDKPLRFDSLAKGIAQVTR